MHCKITGLLLSVVYFAVSSEVQGDRRVAGNCAPLLDAGLPEVSVGQGITISSRDRRVGSDGVKLYAKYVKLDVS